MKNVQGWLKLWANFTLIGIFSQSVGPSLAIWASPVRFSFSGNTPPRRRRPFRSADCPCRQHTTHLRVRSVLQADGVAVAKMMKRSCAFMHFRYRRNDPNVRGPVLPQVLFLSSLLPQNFQEIHTRQTNPGCGLPRSSRSYIPTVYGIVCPIRRPLH